MLNARELAFSGQCSSCLKDSHQALLDEIIYRPVFILGHPRSGTTLLYRLLAMSGCFNQIMVYHLLYFDYLIENHLLNREIAAKEELNLRFAALGLKNRIMDETPVNSDLPEEYAFLLQLRTGKFKLTPKNLPLFDRLCRIVNFLGDPSKTILLKNPWDFTNFLYIHSVFPEAKFIFIHRHPLDILNSQIKALRTNWDNGNPYLEIMLPSYALIRSYPVIKWSLSRLLSPNEPFHLFSRILTTRLTSIQNEFRRLIGKLPTDSFISIRYEDLCRSAHGTIYQVLDFLGLSPIASMDYRSMISVRPRKLDSDLEATQVRLCRKLGCGLDENDYTP